MQRRDVKRVKRTSIEFQEQSGPMYGCLYDFKIPYGPRREKTCLRGFATNTGADQPAHPRSLISAFVIRLLESIISRLATSEISLF